MLAGGSLTKPLARTPLRFRMSSIRPVVTGIPSTPNLAGTSPPTCRPGHPLGRRSPPRASVPPIPTVPPDEPTLPPPRRSHIRTLAGPSSGCWVYAVRRGRPRHLDRCCSWSSCCLRPTATSCSKMTTKATRRSPRSRADDVAGNAHCRANHHPLRLRGIAFHCRPRLVAQGGAAPTQLFTSASGLADRARVHARGPGCGRDRASH